MRLLHSKLSYAQIRTIKSYTVHNLERAYYCYESKNKKGKVKTGFITVESKR